MNCSAVWQAVGIGCLVPDESHRVTQPGPTQKERISVVALAYGVELFQPLRRTRRFDGDASRRTSSLMDIAD